MYGKGEGVMEHPIVELNIMLCVMLITLLYLTKHVLVHESNLSLIPIYVSKLKLGPVWDSIMPKRFHGEVVFHIIVLRKNRVFWL